MYFMVCYVIQMYSPNWKIEVIDDTDSAYSSMHLLLVSAVLYVGIL